MHSTLSLATTSSPSSSITIPTSPANSSPKVYNSFDLLVVKVGRVFNIQIPIDTFHDREDGNTRNLILTCLDGDHKPLSKESWLQFNSTTQTLYGVVLRSQTEKIKASNEYLLVARDSAGNEVFDAFTISVREESEVFAEYTLRILEIDIEKFNEDTSNVLLLVKKITSYYGDKDASYIQVISVNSGSVLFTWSNITIQSCNKTLIDELSLKITTPEGDIQPSFYEALLPEFLVKNIYANKTGPCVPVVTEVPSVLRVSSHRDKLWLKYFIPGLVVAIIVIIIAIVCFVLRRHTGVKVLKADKQTFKRRKPIILDDEHEMWDLSSKAIELPRDSLTPIMHFPEETSSIANNDFEDKNFPQWLSPIQSTPPYLPPEYGRPHGDVSGYRTPPPPYKLPPSY